MAKEVTTNKEINNTSLSFFPDISGSRTDFTQINTYLWDSSGNPLEQEENVPLPISSIRKLVHAVNINWDKPSRNAVPSLIQLNEGNDIETTDDLIYVLEKLAYIALHGNNSSIGGLPVNNITIIESNNGLNSHEKIITYNGLVNNLQNENIKWELTENSGNIIFENNDSSVTELLGTSVNLALNISVINSNRGTLSLPNNTITNNENEYILVPTWQYNNVSYNWSTIHNKSEEAVIIASYENANPESRNVIFNYNYNLVDQIISFKLGSNTETSSIDNTYFTINSAEINGKGKCVKIVQKKLLDSGMPGSTTIKIKCIAKSILDSNSANQMVVEKEYTLAQLGLNVYDETSDKNMCVYALPVAEDNFGNNQTELINELINNLNIYIDINSSEIELNKDIVNAALDTLGRTIIAGHRYVVYYFIPKKYNKIEITLSSMNNAVDQTSDGFELKVEQTTYNNMAYKVYRAKMAIRNAKIKLKE